MVERYKLTIVDLDEQMLHASLSMTASVPLANMLA